MIRFGQKSKCCILKNIQYLTVMRLAIN